MAALVRKNEQKYKSTVKQISQATDKFSLNFGVPHLKSAITLREQLLNDKEMREANFAIPTIKVHATEVFKNSFTFPQIALNDFA